MNRREVHAPIGAGVTVVYNVKQALRRCISVDRGANRRPNCRSKDILIACRTEKWPSLRDWFDNLPSEDLRRIGARIDNAFH